MEYEFSGPEFARIIVDSPTLTARLRELHDLREQALATALATESAKGPDDMGPRAAAALLSGAHRVLFDETVRLTLEGQSADEIAAALTRAGEEVFDLLEPALADYAVRETDPH